MQVVQVPFGHTFVTRIAPDAGPEHFKSYTLSAPLRTHWKKATCEEYECDEFMYGFVLTLDSTNPMFEQQYHYVTHDKTRKYSMQRVGPNIYKFLYGPGNDGMGEPHGDHRVPVGRPPFMLVSDGDWRGNPRGTRPYQHRRIEDWVDDHATQIGKINDIRKRG